MALWITRPRAGDTSVILGFSQQSVKVWVLSVVPGSHGNVGRHPHLPAPLTPGLLLPLPRAHPAPASLVS